MPRVLVLMVFLGTVLPAGAVAQLPMLEGLFNTVTDVHLFGTIAWFADRPSALAGSMRDGQPKSGSLTGLGFEVSFEVGEFSPRRRTTPEDTSVTRTRDTVEVQEKLPDGSVVIYKPREKKEAEIDRDNRWLAELAIGYTELRDFESALTGLDVFGAIRELPAVSLYFSHLPAGPDDKKLAWYVGVRTGLAQLQGLRAYTGTADDGAPDQIYSGGGSTFEFGIVTGVSIDFGSLTLFLEPGYTHRQFSAVEWDGIDGNIDEVLPRSLDMSTWAISAGTQIGIGAAAKKD